jgi:hypothetical protein
MYALAATLILGPQVAVRISLLASDREGMEIALL